MELTFTVPLTDKGKPYTASVVLCLDCLTVEAGRLLDGDGTGEYAAGGLTVTVVPTPVPEAAHG